MKLLFDIDRMQKGLNIDLFHTSFDLVLATPTLWAAGTKIVDFKTSKVYKGHLIRGFDVGCNECGRSIEEEEYNSVWAKDKNDVEKTYYVCDRCVEKVINSFSASKKDP